ncbi:hypothetical protein BDW02DRAFT_603765 [Decorospora gaudefroyi]|uniref:Uncharacterized protein n=1 Tax=Decorospora gaudefroyi TaxID=184978 RepID=A0A6A5K3X4_9PLEO|nr:hypothetical protein BDW02DRAFT_603765 [Decorospora gaudefroyi]
MKKCKVCKTDNHHGKQCTALYLTDAWWRTHGRDLGANPPVQVHPTAGQWAYLVLAGVLVKPTSLKDPVVPNMEHPLVKEFYKAQVAQVILPPGTDHDETREGVEVAQQPEVTVVSSRVQEDVGEDEAGFRVHDICDSRIAKLEKELRNVSAQYEHVCGQCERQQAEVQRALTALADQNNRIARLEAVVTDASSLTGQKRARLGDDVGGN